MKTKTLLLLAPFAVTCGCAETRVDPCGLLALDEVMRLAPGAIEYERAPPGRNNDNELCLWHDGKNRNVFMLFYFSSPDADPEDLVKSGMSGSNFRTVAVADVGSGAAAGFGKAAGGSGGEVMGLFAAKSEHGTIGIRVQGIRSEKSEKFRALKEIARSALSGI